MSTFRPKIGHKLQVVNDGGPPDLPYAGRAQRAPRRVGRFTQADLTKVLKAAKQAGAGIALVRIEPDGSILIVPGDPDRVTVSAENNDWDKP